MAVITEILKKAAAGEQQAPVGTKEAAGKIVDIGRLLSIAANLKVLHIKTKSYAKHMALDTAFDELGGAIDTFIECLQGREILKNGKRLDVGASEYSFKLPADGGVMQAVKDMAGAFDSEAGAFVAGDSALQSALDDTRSCFYQLLYRLDLNG